MACFKPLKAWHHGSAGVSFKRSSGASRELLLPCGQCTGCRLDRSVAWSLRIMHESLFHSDSCFVTLTYDDDHLPYGGDLHYPHVQLFHKRMREKLGKSFRFVLCGEYGERFHRPHYHAIYFNVAFADRYPWRKSAAGFQLYRSELLESLWDLGGAEIGELTTESAAYVARYCMKKMTGKGAEAHYEKLVCDTGEIIQLTPEFMRCSNGGRAKTGGIGKAFFERYRADMYPRDEVIMDARSHKVPRYYDKLLEVSDPDTLEELRSKRILRAMACKDDCTHDRLLVRETVLRARLSFKQRTLE